MNRKTCIFTLMVLTIALILIPSVSAESLIQDVEIKKDLPQNLVAGNSYEMLVLFKTVVKEPVTLYINITVTCVKPLGFNEILVDWVKLNGDVLNCIETAAGIFSTPIGGELEAMSNNVLDIKISTVVNLMPETYTFEIDLMGEEMVEPEPEPEPEPSPWRPRPVSNKKPVAEAGPDHTVYVGQFIEFSGANSTDLDGSIISYEWDFGDGAEASGVNVSHRYMMPDNYTVTLTVRDNRYGEDTDTCMITVIEEIITPPPLPPYLDNLNIEPDVVELGGYVTISFDIMNLGSQPINYGVDLYIGGVNVTRIWIQLGAYESLEILYAQETDTVGEFNVSVHRMTGSFTVEAPEIPPKPAEFVLSDLSITPEEVEPGDEVTISVLVTNIGEETGDYTITLDVPAGPFLRIQETVSLEGGESERVEFKISRDIEGTYQVEVDGLTGSFIVKTPPTPAEFVLSNFIFTYQIQEGESFELSIDVLNIGETAGEVVIIIEIDGEVAHTLDSYLEPGGEASKTWITFHPYEVGNHTIRLDGFEGTFDVIAKPVPLWERPEFIVLGIFVAIIIAGAAYIYFKKVDLSGWT